MLFKLDSAKENNAGYIEKAVFLRHVILIFFSLSLETFLAF